MASLFTPASVSFLTRLARNNRRDWFEAHRAEYELHVRRPLRTLVEELDVRLARLAPEIVGDPRRSVFRIHRDIRFSRDKSPYKTHAAAWFYHRDAGKGVGQESSGGAGWMPPREALARLRVAIVEDPVTFERLVTGASFRRQYGRLDEEAMLSRPPRGYSADHPAARWLYYKSFTAGVRLSRQEVLSPALPARLSQRFAGLLPLVRWINTALGFRTATDRLG